MGPGEGPGGVGVGLILLGIAIAIRPWDPGILPTTRNILSVQVRSSGRRQSGLVQDGRFVSGEPRMFAVPWAVLIWGEAGR